MCPRQASSYAHRNCINGKQRPTTTSLLSSLTHKITLTPNPSHLAFAQTPPPPFIIFLWNIKCVHVDTWEKLIGNTMVSQSVNIIL